MNTIMPGTVVPFRVGNVSSRGDAHLQKTDAMKAYTVTAFYDYPPVERSVVVEADAPQRAMVKALLEGMVPAYFRKDEFGWLLPIFWHPRLAGGRRGKKDRLIFEVDEAGP